MMRKNWCASVGAALLLLGWLALPAAALAQEEQKVDINTASQKELETLPGIGPALASRIIEHREKNGPFQRVEELMNVPGIAEKKFELLKNRIQVSEQSKKPEPPKGSTG